jgi:hypothetical protein
VYSNAYGAIGALVPITACQNPGELIQFHGRARQIYEERIGLIQETMRSRISFLDVVDSDVLSLYPCLDHVEPVPATMDQLLAD